MNGIKTKDIVAYATLPRIIPRAKVLLFSGFGYVAFLIAQIYAMVRLLPKGHPYLDSKNIGRFGIHHVIAQAGRNLQFSSNNIDQIAIFFILLSGVAILFIQLALAIYALFDKSAYAWGLLLFDITDPTNDVAFQILNQVFGIPNLFCSSSAPANCPLFNPGIVGAATDSAFHNALHELFAFYSTALLIIGTLIFLYFIVVVLLETAVTGTPFGQRFQNVWVPIRLVVAIALLLPLGYGMNSGQYITLYAAKYGSNFATNGWNAFNSAIALHPLFGLSVNRTDSRSIGERYTLVAVPQQPDVTPLVASMSLIHACAYSYLRYEGTTNAGGQGAGGNPPHYLYGDYTSNARNYKIRPYLVKTPADWMTSVTSPPFPFAIQPDHLLNRWLIEDETSVPYDDAITFYFGGDIIIRFGEYAETATGSPVHGAYEGNVKPYCGDIRVPVTTLLTPAITDPDTYGGASYMLRTYYDMVLQMWFLDVELQQFARSYVTFVVGQGDYQASMCGAAAAAYSGCNSGGGFPPCAPVGTCGIQSIDALFKVENVLFYQNEINSAIRTAWGLYISSTTDPNQTDELVECGWACAGAWYNKVAEINGMFIDGVKSIPTLDLYPLVMEQVRAEKGKINISILSDEQFDPTVRALSGQEAPKLNIGEGAVGLEIAGGLNDVYRFWGSDTLDQSRDDSRSTGNPFIDVMNFMLGTYGLVHMRGANQHIHPLAQLVATGKSLVTTAIQNIGLSSMFAFAGGLLQSTQDPKVKALSSGAETISRMIMSMAFLGLMAGFTLYYVLPFLPFVYFFFAVGTWIKTIFEAMVGTPLWALAHLRIDGEGLPGDAAANGYFLILEIFIRPILTVFGLVAAVTILGAQVHVLNVIWDLTVNNTTGFSADILTPAPVGPNMRTIYQRGVIDEFFFLIIYTIICYMLALASFKLIDQIPNNILRWAGIGVAAFGDINPEHAESISGTVSRGAQTIGVDAADAMRSGAGGLGGALGRVIK